MAFLTNKPFHLSSETLGNSAGHPQNRLHRVGQIFLHAPGRVLSVVWSSGCKNQWDMERITQLSLSCVYNAFKMKDLARRVYGNPLKTEKYGEICFKGLRTAEQPFESLDLRCELSNIKVVSASGAPLCRWIQRHPDKRLPHHARNPTTRRISGIKVVSATQS